MLATVKRNKAAGSDGVDPEHIIFGGQALVSHLARLFNAMIVSSHIPAVFKLGVVIPIPKGRGKDSPPTTGS